MAISDPWLDSTTEGYVSDHDDRIEDLEQRFDELSDRVNQMEYDDDGFDDEQLERLGINSNTETSNHPRITVTETNHTAMIQPLYHQDNGVHINGGDGTISYDGFSFSVQEVEELRNRVLNLEADVVALQTELRSLREENGQNRT